VQNARIESDYMQIWDKDLDETLEPILPFHLGPEHKRICSARVQADGGCLDLRQDQTAAATRPSSRLQLGIQPTSGSTFTSVTAKVSTVQDVSQINQVKSIPFDCVV